MKALKRYWFHFEKSDKPNPLNLGCGVTAFDYDDAIDLLRQRVFAGREMPRIVGHREDVEVRTLDNKHILPNIGSVTIRGIWFPRGYEELK